MFVFLYIKLVLLKKYSSATQVSDSDWIRTIDSVIFYQKLKKIV